MSRTKITNSVLFRAAKFLTESAGVTSEALDKMTSREIVDAYELRSALFRVEYTSAGGHFMWRNCDYDSAARKVAAVAELGYTAEVWRESDWECVTRRFTPTWF